MFEPDGMLYLLVQHFRLGLDFFFDLCQDIVCMIFVIEEDVQGLQTWGRSLKMLSGAELTDICNRKK